MANCRPVCKLCRNLVISQSVAFTGGNLVINIPAGDYACGDKLCLVVAQALPTETTIVAPVVISIGDGEQLYPLTNRCCAQVTACGIRTRTRYSTIISTDATGGTFRMLGEPCCSPENRRASINGTAPTTTPAPTPASAARSGGKSTTT